MCNHYLLDLHDAGSLADYAGFAEVAGPLRDVYPDQLAPVLRSRADRRPEWAMMRWGFPPPPNLASRPVTNVRNLASPYWRGWLAPRWRCLVPFTRFAEWTDAKPKREHFFALGGLAMFAGIWRPWTGTRGPKSAEVTGEHRVFAFLTTEPNEIIRPIHAKAMPVILPDERAWMDWLNAPVEGAIAMVRPLPPERLVRIATPTEQLSFEA